ncbi:unnamed protein product [Rotaria sp. Silwood1]|nr:unnamed protein product [Rotaria sp. Silwood1]CAF1621556.1 unnamed protein product [Rotaria sp. Silwood1]CAF3733407.1 unnamed protein product [Rotaria sp. Silwood1]CAF3754265.1 unnamed protein product [Rotaria sp. Silwood1]CAF4617852.1 unnamed protein product [Rotaria sp. Silwood1]
MIFLPQTTARKEVERALMTEQDSSKAALMNLLAKRLNIDSEESDSDSQGEFNEDQHAQRRYSSNIVRTDQTSQVTICSVYWQYAQDNSNVYFMGKKVDGAYSNSFQVIGDGYAKDNFNVFYMGKKVDNAYANSFQLVGNGYAKDNFNVFYMGKKIANAYANTFKYVGNGYATDNFGVFYMGIKIDGAYPSSFRFISSAYINDYGDAYCTGK